MPGARCGSTGIRGVASRSDVGTSFDALICFGVWRSIFSFILFVSYSEGLYQVVVAVGLILHDARVSTFGEFSSVFGVFLVVGLG